MTPSAERYVAPGNDAVWVPAEVAAVLLSPSGAGLERWRRRVRGEHPEVDSVLVAMRLVALARRQPSRDGMSAHGHDVAPGPDTGAPSPQWLTPSQAAADLDVSDRTVRRYITTGALPARQVADRWLIDPADLAAFSRGRSPTARTHLGRSHGIRPDQQTA